MNQLLQNISNGEITLVDVPCPICNKGSMLIASRNTLVSAGTERMLVDFGMIGILTRSTHVRLLLLGGKAALVHGSELRTDPPVPRAGSCHSIAVRHPETGHRVEDLARQLYLDSLSRGGSTSSPSTDDRWTQPGVWPGSYEQRSGQFRSQDARLPPWCRFPRSR